MIENHKFEFDGHNIDYPTWINNHDKMFFVDVRNDTYRGPNKCIARYDSATRTWEEVTCLLGTTYFVFGEL